MAEALGARISPCAFLPYNGLDRIMADGRYGATPRSIRVLEKSWALPKATGARPTLLIAGEWCDSV